MGNTNPRQDDNQNYASFGHQGTLGTADVLGTSPTIPFSADPATGAQYVYNLGPAGSVSLGNITGGTINQIDNIGTLPPITMGDLTGGTIDILTDGTISKVGTIPGVGVVSNITHGTIENSGTVTGVGVVSQITTGSIVVTAGTVTSTPGNSTGGTLDLVTTVTNLSHGTIENSGTVTGVGVVSSITNGSLVVTTGTVVNNGGTAGTVTGVGVVSAITSGTIQNSGTTTGVGVVSSLTTGSIVVTAGTVLNNGGSVNVQGVGTAGSAVVGGPVNVGGTDSGGTLRSILIDSTGHIHADIETGTINSIVAGTLTNSGTTTGVGVVSNITNGTIRVTAGTVNSGTINAGTINTGTINASTVNSGTFTQQPYPASQVQSAYVVGTGAVGTIVSAAGAGTGIYINSYVLTCMSGTLDMCLSFGLGSTTNQVVARGYFVPGGGVALSSPHPSFYGTANSALTYQILGGAGTASWAVTYNTKGTP